MQKTDCGIGRRTSWRRTSGYPQRHDGKPKHLRSFAQTVSAEERNWWHWHGDKISCWKGLQGALKPDKLYMEKAKLEDLTEALPILLVKVTHVTSYCKPSNPCENQIKTPYLKVRHLPSRVGLWLWLCLVTDSVYDFLYMYRIFRQNKSDLLASSGCDLEH